MPVQEAKIGAFPDGNSFVSFNATLSRLLVGNSEGLVKIFQVDEPDLEPVSIDIDSNLTSLSCHGDVAIVTTTAGTLGLVDVKNSEPRGSIYRSELPLRDSVFINEGKRVICGGDDNKLVVIDTATGKAALLDIPDQLVSLSYNIAGEILSASLSNGDVQIYSVINEVPNLIDTIEQAVASKVHTSMDTVDYNDEHRDELVSTKTQWSKSGEFLVVPFADNSIRVYDRSDWSTTVRTFAREQAEVPVVDFSLSENNKYLAVLYRDQTLAIYAFSNSETLVEYSLKEVGDYVPINVTWNDKQLFVGTSAGHIVKIDDILPSTNSLFLDEAEEDDDEEDESHTQAPLDSETGIDLNRNGIDDSIIDEDDEDQFPYNKDVDTLISERRRKRQKLSRQPSPSVFSKPVETEIVPYSPGSTPYTQAQSSISRRYLFMNSVGYVWSVKDSESGEGLNQQSITVSFFDRSLNKDYHFIDYSQFDLCALNLRGVLLGTSGHKTGSGSRIFYRNHESLNDSWEREIPLVKGEHVTSISITNSDDSNNHNGIIVVGTNFGYLRFFNQHGLCVNIIKTNPIVTLISSSTSILFLVSQLSVNLYAYSLINIHEDYRFIQQDCLLPLKNSTSDKVPLIKGIFFNEYNDPCIVPGNDDTLMILAEWRESSNSRWIPVLNCKDVVTDHGHNDAKKNWKCWPLGSYNDKLMCLIIKNNEQYPGFPLPLPIELNIRIPISVKPPKPDQDNDDLDDEPTDAPKEVEDPEESFVRVSTMGRIVNASLVDEDYQEFNDEIMERLQNYSAIFDKSLLKLFALACQDGKLSKAYSVARLIKNDKALLATIKICQRFEFASLSSKIGKLRDELVNIDQDEY